MDFPIKNNGSSIVCLNIVGGFSDGYITKKYSSSLNKAIPRKTLPLYSTGCMIAKKQTSDREYIYSKLGRLIML